MSIRVGMRAMARVLGAVDRCPEPVELVAAVASAYSLCSTLPWTRLTVSQSSEYFTCVPGEETLTVSLTSTYSLSTAVT